ncbi:MAG: Crp/Fnr family transcriptional regulator [Saprospiraceae bacterium]|nr:Crp/Fnr family transcriptional regulator [Saprospiraceae bacterium]
MDKESIESWVQEHFSQITDPALIKEIAEYGLIKTFKGGEIIMDYGSYIRMVPLVIKGAIKVLREDDQGRELFLYYLQEGDTCPASFTCCLTSKRSFIKTVAEEDTTVLTLPVKQVDDWISKYRNWKDFIMMAYDFRIMELVQTIDSIAFMRMDERLLKYLEDKVEATGVRTIQSTHQEIAWDLNASREAVSRLLKKLEDQGTIKLGRNRIELLK